MSIKNKSCKHESVVVGTLPFYLFYIKVTNVFKVIPIYQPLYSSNSLL